MKKVILYIFMITTLFASEQVDVDRLIQKIKNAPAHERYKEMNELKRVLKSKNTSFRKEILLKLQSNMHPPKEKNIPLIGVPVVPPLAPIQIPKAPVKPEINPIKHNIPVQKTHIVPKPTPPIQPQVQLPAPHVPHDRRPPR